MQKFPHHYAVTATTSRDANVDLGSDGLPRIDSAPPAEFGGPGDRWSPETLLVAAVADCFVLTFKAIARASKFDWNALTCAAKGTLDRIDNVTRFTEITLHVVLDVPPGTDEQKAMRFLEKSEHACLITNSLKSSSHLDATVRIAN
ncbi:MAG TPA: OsmC family protein [Woeseiaceae bacterium]|nr:OsmC family protein [Woeseiaceae bacterium]